MVFEYVSCWFILLLFPHRLGWVGLGERLIFRLIHSYLCLYFFYRW